MENRMLRKIGMNWEEGGEICIVRSFVICNLRQVDLE
jgi:hypothetical protein